jgi:hypothetical protein
MLSKAPQDNIEAERVEDRLFATHKVAREEPRSYLLRRTLRERNDLRVALESTCYPKRLKTI